MAFSWYTQIFFKRVEKETTLFNLKSVISNNSEAWGYPEWLKEWKRHHPWRPTLTKLYSCCHRTRDKPGHRAHSSAGLEKGNTGSTEHWPFGSILKTTDNKPSSWHSIPDSFLIPKRAPAQINQRTQQSPGPHRFSALLNQPLNC